MFAPAHNPPHSTGLIILGVIVIILRIYFAFRYPRQSKPRSPRVQRIEKILAISLWSFIAMCVALLLLSHR